MDERTRRFCLDFYMRYKLLFLSVLTWYSSSAQITALTNHVKYKNGDSYIAPDFKYAGTGFVIQDGNKTYAVTAKHVLWIAKNRNSQTVTINNDLKSWVLKPKTGDKDSVVIDKLINDDNTEILEGPGSTIMERDVLVFSVKSITPGIRRLKLRSGNPALGEKVSIIGNPYAEPDTKTYDSRIVARFGLDILIDSPGENFMGISGSPVVDSNGEVIGVFSSASSYNGKNVVVAISTEYLKNVLDHKKDVNKPKLDYGELIFRTAMTEGAQKAIRQYYELRLDMNNWYVYNLRSANRNGLLEAGERLVEANKLADAIAILEHNTMINSTYFHSYNKLASALALAGNKDEAIKNYKKSIELYGEPEENPAFEELRKLENK